MDTSALVVVIIGTLLFVGFAVWGAFYSRGKVLEEIPLNQTEQRAGNVASSKID